MLALRILGVVLVSMGLMALGADILFWLETDTFAPHSVLALIGAINQGGASDLHAWAGTLPQPVSGAVNGFLRAWGFLAFGVPGALLAIPGFR